LPIRSVQAVSTSITNNAVLPIATCCSSSTISPDFPLNLYNWFVDRRLCLALVCCQNQHRGYCGKQQARVCNSSYHVQTVVLVFLAGW
jgi:hypothetical protein